MALVWIALNQGKSADYRSAVATSVHRALVETFHLGENDLIQIVAGGQSEALRYDRQFAKVERSADLVLIQVTAEDTRSAAQKQAFYRRLVELLGAAPGVRSNDIVVNLVDAPKENWFFGIPV
jgi:4-oxalocrotonate tautomerase